VRIRIRTQNVTDWQGADSGEHEGAAGLAAGAGRHQPTHQQRGAGGRRGVRLRGMDKNKGIVSPDE
jgi:hypothetical protein